jgi:hypothetical protein
MAVLINLGTGAGSTNGDTLYEAFVKINTNYSDLESISNKSINVTTDGASNTKYPSVKAVKTYVDTNITAAELLINKSINVTTDGASDTKYPSVKAVKTYVDANAGGFTAKTSGNIDAVSGSKATLEYDINTVNKDGGSEVKLPTTTEIGKEVLVLAYNYSGTIQVYANEAEEAKLSGGQNGISGAQGNLTINPREAYRFISLSGGYWYFEKIIDIPSDLYLLTSERSTNIVTDGASNFKVPSVKAVKDYVDANAGLPYEVYNALLTQTGTNPPVLIEKLNTTGRTFTTTYNDVGTYNITMTGSNLTQNNVSCTLSNTSRSESFADIKFNGGVVFTIDTSRQNTTTFQIENSNDRLKYSSLEIKVYN